MGHQREISGSQEASCSWRYPDLGIIGGSSPLRGGAQAASREGRLPPSGGQDVGVYTEGSEAAESWRLSGERTYREEKGRK